MPLPEKNQQAKTHKTQVWPWKAERSQHFRNLPSCDKLEVCTSHHHEQRRYRHRFNDHHLQHSSDWNSQWDSWQTSSEKKLWITAEILDLCDKKRELRKKRFEPDESEKYKEVNNNIKRCMKKAKENWIGEQCREIEKNLRRTTVRGHTNWWETWPLWNRGKWLLSKIVQENASKTNDRYWTDGKNTTLSCTIRRPVEIHQYWTVPRQTQRPTIPSIAKKCRLQCSYWIKGSKLELTKSQKNWFNQVEKQ